MSSVRIALAWLALVAVAVAGCSLYVNQANDIDDKTTIYAGTPPGWDLCLFPGCAPGGNGTPTSITQTFGDMTHTLDANGAMKMAFIDPAASQGTDWLEPWKNEGGASDNAHVATLTHFIGTVSFFPDTNAGTYVTRYEIDHAIFSPNSIGANTPKGTNYMFGLQCNLSSNLIQIWNGGTGGGWVTATWAGGNIPCTAPANQWNSLVVYGHLVTGDQTSCTSGGDTFPTDHYDLIIWDGLPYIPTNTNTCAQPLPTIPPFFQSSVIQQVQCDEGAAGSGGNTASVWYDKMKMLYY